ncbi:Polysaccharide deacetylase domain protein [Vulgatibacter incomptus]|uniref:Polysaccharide deacetylase domain protein n=1 Tax=Vulgatibacter incomptus TaxID=1391653 RepID=A0A0K1P846_9BACT|nr:Polysaccharide deacetylase domain protein [Vulgatibacter incomptus]
MRAPERFCELLDRQGVHATFFANADDLHDDASALAVAGAARLGHEIAALFLPADERTRAAIGGAVTRIGEVAGRRPLGFRLLEWPISAALLEILEDQGLLYDASAPFPGFLAQPRTPYRPNPRAPAQTGSAKLVELPTSTIPFLRRRLDGGLFVTLPRPAMAALYRSLRKRTFLGIRLQGADLLDENDGLGRELARKRRALSLSSATKRHRLGELVAWLQHDFEVVTLEEAALRLAPSLG